MSKLPPLPKPSRVRDLDGDGDVDAGDSTVHDLNRDGRIDGSDDEVNDLDKDHDIDARDRLIPKEKQQQESVREALGRELKNTSRNKLSQDTQIQGHKAG